MQPRTITITALITLLAASTTAITPNVSQPFSAQIALAQAPLTRNPEAYRLIEQGNKQYKTSEFQAAIQSWQQALAIYQKSGEQIGEGIALINLGHAYFSLGEYQKALAFYQQSLVIQQQLRDCPGEANSLNHLGEVYRVLGQYQKAIEFYQKSLALIREIGQSAKTDHYALLQQEATSLGNLGNAYRNLGQYQKAIEVGEQSLALLKKMSELPSRDSFALLKEKVNSLTNLGHVYFYLGNYQKAVECYKQSLAVVREIGDRQGEANTLGGLGNIYYSSEQYQNGMKIYQQSLAIARGIGDRTSEGIVLNNIGALLATNNQPELAIIFYKQSVNVREAIRRDIQGLPKEQQQSYIETIANTYRSLADLLLKQDRVLEAQRVLDLLKVQELEDYLHDVRASENLGNGIADRAPEQQIKKGYEAILNQAIEQGKELSQLESLPVSNRTEVQQQRVIELRKNQEQITQQFQEFIKSPEVAALLIQLRQTTVGEGFDLDKYATSLQDNLKRLQQGAVILYPFVLEDRLELVLVTSYTPPIRRTVAVKRKDLNRAILEFRDVLKTPSRDARDSAQKLYNWLIKPIANDLAQAKAKTIIYAPDGQLRYIPIAALYDGNQWLVQRFGINNITALSLTEFNTKPQSKLHIFAGAFTQGNYNIQIGSQQFNFQGLKYAGIEIENLAKIVPSTTRLLDQQFNRDTVLQMNDYSVVHLATHAAFVEGQPEQSFILFGDGKYVTLRDVGSWRLPNVDLVVLSACETGLGDKLGDGKEVLGFGYQMQRAGARAAIASLWQVDDGGTQAMMDAFYAALENGSTTKAEALRQAQIALITGDYKALGQQRGLEVQQGTRSRLSPTVNSRLSHPYYWAPFILIGNGL